MLKPNINIYKCFITCMASSVSGQMNQILRCDWLPKRAFFFLFCFFYSNIINVSYFHFYEYVLSAVVFERKKIGQAVELSLFWRFLSPFCYKNQVVDDKRRASNSFVGSG